MKKILITGSNGFIGKNLIQELKIRSYQILALVRPSTDLSFFKNNNINYIVDTKNAIELKEEIKNNNIDGVIHLASLYIKAHNESDITELCESNITFGARLLESIQKTNVKWFINTGTFWQHFNNKDYSPVNLYAATKQAFESVLTFYQETSDIKYITIKINDTFGPNDTRPKIINLLMNLAKSGKELNMSGGDQLIDITYIQDIVSGFSQVVDALVDKDPSLMSGDCYSIHANEVMSLKDIVSIFEKRVNTKLNINWAALPYRDREVMRPWTGGKSIPNWKPKFSFVDGLDVMLKEDAND
jgi:nucleoside-diphosphate-sugar epimerase